MAAPKHIGALEQGIYVFGLQILRERSEFEHPGGIMLQAGPPRIGAGAVGGTNQLVGIEIRHERGADNTPTAGNLAGAFE